MNCETRKRGKLCGRDECKPCFERSFASHENSKYMAEGQENPLLIARSSDKKYSFVCEECRHIFKASPHSVTSGRFCPFCGGSKLCELKNCEKCYPRSFASHPKSACWDIIKNKQTPRDVFVSSQKKYWFKCGVCKHSFEMRPSCISKGRFCAFCSNNKLCDSLECEVCFEKSFVSCKKIGVLGYSEKQTNAKRRVYVFGQKILVQVRFLSS
ncbi:restriction endonuclease [Tunisvirus fontaine2]|uniref:Restriction endonuclease n=1 Tax=Tunisvirus fontaine2 TaxID=1421067 RepID=V9SGG9_9VIRU|nr:restriction endonuclease [Tunisvirus fontaine2]AHC54984.1 restriction endonuclease [Tunisvirus fontaine2]